MNLLQFTVIASAALLLTVARCSGVATTSSSCFAHGSTNVTNGVPLGPRRFVVTSQDCCDACGSTAGCVGAVWATTYFCQMYSSVTDVSTDAPGSTYLVLPTTAAPTAAPTPAPTPRPAPTQVALLTSCLYSTCNREEDYTCSTQVVPFGSCVPYKKDRFVQVRQIEADSSIVFSEYTNAGCSGSSMNTLSYPSVCKYEESQLQYMQGVVVSFEEKANQEVSYLQCSDPYCASSTCNVNNQVTTGQCSTTGKKHVDYCIPGWVVKFPDCDVWSVGTADPLNTCCYNDEDLHFVVKCS